MRDIVAGSLVGDGTGYSVNLFVRRFGIRHNRTATKRGRIKLHSIMLDAPDPAQIQHHLQERRQSCLLTHESLTAMAS